MNRKKFIELVGMGTGAVVTSSIPNFSLANPTSAAKRFNGQGSQLNADLVIAGGGVGGCAAALAALRNNLSVIMTEETDWIGGQLTQQGVPPDEHPWIETHGATALYRSFRKGVRDYYRIAYPLTKSARAEKYLNPVTVLFLNCAMNQRFL
jgi:NADPH-dependent 2,4-dienoyl-CoA reductase/sulfur reductase-like enzyme